jgi:hypothetical protein
MQLHPRKPYGFSTDEMWVSSSETTGGARFTTQYLRHCCSFAKCGYRSIHPPFKNGGFLLFPMDEIIILIGENREVIFLFKLSDEQMFATTSLWQL